MDHMKAREIMSTEPNMQILTKPKIQQTSVPAWPLTADAACTVGPAL